MFGLSRKRTKEIEKVSGSLELTVTKFDEMVNGWKPYDGNLLYQKRSRLGGKYTRLVEKTRPEWWVSTRFIGTCSLSFFEAIGR